MVEPVAGLVPHPRVGRVRKVDRKPTSRDEDKNNNKKDRRAERENKGLSQNRSLGDKGAVCDILL